VRHTRSTCRSLLSRYRHEGFQPLGVPVEHVADRGALGADLGRLQPRLLFLDPLTKFSDLNAAASGEQAERQLTAVLWQPSARVDHGLGVPKLFLKTVDRLARGRHRLFQLSDLLAAALRWHRWETPALTQAIEFLSVVAKDRLLFQQRQPGLLPPLVVEGDSCSSLLVALCFAGLELSIPRSHLGF